MHGLASLCREAGNGGNNEQRCPKYTRTISFSALNKKISLPITRFPAQNALDVADEVALDHYQFRVLVEVLHLRQQFLSIFAIDFLSQWSPVLFQPTRKAC